MVTQATSSPSVPIQLGFRNMEPSPAVAARIEAEVQKLRRYCPDIVGCRVIVESLHQHHRRGQHFQIHIELWVPGSEIAVCHEPPARQVLNNAGAKSASKRTEVDAPHKDAYVAIRDAFAAARRRLQDRVGRRQTARVRGGSVRAGATRRRRKD